MTKYNRLILISFLGFLLLAACGIFNVQSAYAAANPMLKVGLLHGNAAVSEIAVASDGELVIAEVSGEDFIIKQSLNTNAVQVKTENGVVSIYDNNSRLIYGNVALNEVVAARDFSNQPIRIGQYKYRGGVCFFPVAAKMNVINVINLEHYLYGVIHAEIGKSSPAETLKAQAVTARSYVMANPHRHTKDGFDICTSVHCQTYRGYRDEYPETRAAVDSTAGAVMQYNGKIVQGFYSKNSGGHTDNSSDIWGGETGYLKGVRDEYSPEYPWVFELNLAELSNALLKKGQIVGEITDINIVERFNSGSVAKLEIKGSLGKTFISSNSFRNMVGASKLKSLMFTVESGSKIHKQADFRKGYNASASHSNDNYDNSGDGYSYDELQNLKVLNGENNLSSISGGYAVDSASNLSFLEGDRRVYVVSKTVKIPGKQGEKISMPGGYTPAVATSENFAVSPGANSVFLCGVGWGHGIGMPQDSAIVMGKRGLTYQEILNYFYTGIELVRI